MLDFHKTMRTAQKMNIENVKNNSKIFKNNVLPRSQPLFCRGLQNIVPATENEPEASEVLVGNQK